RIAMRDGRSRVDYFARRDLSGRADHSTASDWHGDGDLRHMVAGHDGFALTGQGPGQRETEDNARAFARFVSSRAGGPPEFRRWRAGAACTLIRCHDCVAACELNRCNIVSPIPGTPYLALNAAM